MIAESRSASHDKKTAGPKMVLPTACFHRRARSRIVIGFRHLSDFTFSPTSSMCESAGGKLYASQGWG